MSQQTTRLQLPFLQSGQAQKHVTVNESLLRLDALVQLSVVSATTAAQPGAPADGDIYILPAGKTGADWGGMANGALAYYRDGVWEALTPRTGHLAYVADVNLLLRYAGGAWASLADALQLSASDRILGRVSSGGGAAEEVTFTDQAQALCDDASFRDMCATLGAWHVLAHSAVAASVTGTTSETTLATVAVPANALGPNGMLRITSLWSFTSSANTKTLKVAFGGSNFVHITPTATQSFQTVTTIFNRNAANAQVGPITAAGSGGGFGSLGSSLFTATVDTTTSKDVQFKATLANAGESITLEAYLIELARGA